MTITYYKILKYIEDNKLNLVAYFNYCHSLKKDSFDEYNKTLDLCKALIHAYDYLHTKGYRQQQKSFPNVKHRLEECQDLFEKYPTMKNLKLLWEIRSKTEDELGIAMAKTKYYWKGKISYSTRDNFFPLMRKKGHDAYRIGIIKVNVNQDVYAVLDSKNKIITLLRQDTLNELEFDNILDKNSILTDLRRNIQKADIREVMKKSFNENL